MRGLAILLTTVLLLAGGPAAAYVGPGAGVGAMGAVLGVLIAVGSALGIVLFWPLRQLFRRARGRAAPTAEDAPAPHA